MRRLLAGTWSSRSGRIGLVLVGAVLAMAAVASVWTPYPPGRAVPQERWQGASGEHWFGTDGAGKDLFSQVLAGSRTTLFVVVVAVAIAAAIGLTLGLLAGLTPRWLGDSLGYLIDILIALPGLILALVLVAALEASLWTVSLAIGIGSGVALARVVKAESSSVVLRDYVLAAHSSGSSTWRTLWRHIVPNIAPTLIVQLSIVGAFAVLSEAGLSFLGLTPVSSPSWGRMLDGLQQSVTVHPTAIIWPGLAVVLATLGFNLVGDGLREAVDPRLRTATAGDGRDERIGVGS